MKVKKKAAAEVSSDVNDEKPLNVNDTKEIQDFIKELGLDKFTPEVLDQSESTRTKKLQAKKSPRAEKITPPAAKAFSSQAERKHPSKLPNAKHNKFDRQATTSNGTNLRDTEDSKETGQTAVTDDISQIPIADLKRRVKNLGNQGGLLPAGQNKKIVFEEALVSSSNDSKPKDKNLGNQGGLLPAGQNKKIVFDESYIKNPEDSVTEEKDEAWYKLLVRPDVPWYQQGKQLKAPSGEPTPEEVRKCEEEGRRYLEEDTVNFQKVRALGAEKSENRWMQTVLKSGAFTDKIAAHTLLLQESAPHNLASLKYLISLLDVKGRRECLASLDALLRLFTEGKILNPNAKLNLVSRQPIGALRPLTLRERKEQLALWSFEYQLKDYYNQFIQALDGMLKDAVETTRRKALAALSTLLAYSPEQEQGLLARLVNKVGDPTRGVATTAVAQLERLLQMHGNMKTVVVAEVERLLYRPNINAKAQYYALCFLSQILLDEEDAPLAVKLIVIYVSFFKACVKKGEVDSKLMAALLTGVRRAFPYTKGGGTGTSGTLEAHVDTLFKLVHMVRFSLGVQVLCILDQIVTTDPGNVDRFYSVLFRKLFDAELGLSTKQSMFLNLLYRALKRDTSAPRLRAFLKRILQVCLSCPPQLTCGLLYLLSELLKMRPELRTFPKEILKRYIPDPEEEDDEEEHYKDVDDDDDDEEEGEEGDSKPSTSAAAKDNPEDRIVTSTWVHRNNSHLKASGRTGYDPLARNPLFGRAEQSGGLWEMNLLTKHFHPSVALFANTIKDSMPVEYTGDPLQDFTLVRFLDRFVFRNPKEVSASQVRKGPAQKRILGKRSLYTPRGVRAMAVDSKQFVQQHRRNIPADEMFLYQYFKQRAAKTPAKLKRDKDDDDDDASDLESVASEEFEEYLAEGADFDFAADMKSKPKAEKKKKKKDTEDGEDDDDEEGGEEAGSDLEAAEVDSDEDFDNDEEFQDAFKDFDDMLNDSAEPGEDIDGEEVDLGEPEDDEGGFREEDAEFSDDESDVEVAPKTSKTKATKSSKKRAVEDDVDDLDFLDDDDDDKNSKKKKRKRDLFASSDGLDFVAAEDFAAMLESNAVGAGLMKTAGTTEALANKDKASVKQLQWEMNRDRWIKGKDHRSSKRGRGKPQGRGGGGGKSKSKKSLSGPAFRKSRAKRGGKR